MHSIGIDLGTSGLKAVLLDVGGTLPADQHPGHGHGHGHDRSRGPGHAGHVIAEAEAAYPVESPQDGWAQSAPQDWHEALGRALGQLAAQCPEARPEALAVTGQMHGTVLVDSTGEPVAPAVLWPDRRAARQLERWRSLPDRVRGALANPLVPGMTGPVLTWFTAHRPDLLLVADKVLLPKDEVRHWLTGRRGQPVTDRSDASATLLWDVVADDWAHPVRQSLALSPGLLPEVVPSDRVVGSADLSSWFPGCDQVPTVAGCADTAASRIAVGRPALQLNLGTGGQLLRGVDRVPAGVLDPPVHTYADDRAGWYAMAAIQNAGLALDWVRGILGLNWEAFFAAAQAAAPGAAGVAFVPYLTGERGGIAGAEAAGSWHGLTLRTSTGDLARSALEGMTFALASGLALLPAGSGDGDDRLVLTGGGGRHPLVQQLLADLTDLPVQHVPVRSASAVGAALLAARGVGLVGGTTLPERWPTTDPLPPPTMPGPDAEAHREAWREWQRHAPGPGVS